MVRATVWASAASAPAPYKADLEQIPERCPVWVAPVDAEAEALPVVVGAGRADAAVGVQVDAEAATAARTLADLTTASTTASATGIATMRIIVDRSTSISP